MLEISIEFSQVFMIIFCLFISAFYSGSEAILMSLGVDRVKQIIENGKPRTTKTMNFLLSHFNELLTTILVGNNIVNILLTAMMTTIMTNYFKDHAIGISVGVTTLLILFFGEVVPKTYARKYAERSVLFVIHLLKVQYYLFYPLVKLIILPMKVILGKDSDLKERLITNSDIEYMVNRAEEENTIDSKQVELLNSILEFPRIKVKDIMIARSNIKYIKKSATFQEILGIVEVDGHSRYPVCDKELEQTIGFLHVKDLTFVRSENRINFCLKKILKKPFFVYEHMKIQAVFDHMNKRKIHLALVKDEMGVVVGIITLEDIIEEVFGEIQDEHDPIVQEIEEKYTNHHQLQGGVCVNGSISLRDLDGNYGIKIPLNNSYSTLNGFLLEMLGNHFPEKDHVIVWEGIAFTLTEVIAREIKLVHCSGANEEKKISSREQDEENEKSHPFLKRTFA